jgi:hypothetical protein
LLVVLEWLENDKLAMEERDAIATDAVTKRRVKGSGVELGERRGRREAIEKELSNGILAAGGGPIERRRNGSSSRDCVDKRASDELRRRVGGVDRSE